MGRHLRAVKFRVPPMLKCNRVIAPDSLYNRGRNKDFAKHEILQAEKDYEEEKNELGFGFLYRSGDFDL